MGMIGMANDDLSEFPSMTNGGRPLKCKSCKRPVLTRPGGTGYPDTPWKANPNASPKIVLCAQCMKREQKKKIVKEEILMRIDKFLQIGDKNDR